MPWIDKDFVYFPYQSFLKAPLKKKKNNKKNPKKQNTQQKKTTEIDDISHRWKNPRN